MEGPAAALALVNGLTPISIAIIYSMRFAPTSSAGWTGGMMAHAEAIARAANARERDLPSADGR